MTSQILIDILSKIGLKDHGENPHDRFPAHSPTYAPQHMAIVHLKSTGPWNLSVIHAHFNCAGKDAQARLDMASDILKWKLSDNANWNFTAPGAPYQPAKNEYGFPAEYLHFRPFEFGSPHDICFFFEHSGTMRFDPSMLVKLTDAQGNATKMSENEAFFGARDVTLDMPSNEVKKQGTVLLLENHFTVGKIVNKREIKASDKRLQYKLNLVYGVDPDATDPSQVISMIIDPDTGNGMGTEP